MNHRTEQKSQEQEQIAESHSQQTSIREFATSDELIRHDAAQTEVPPVIAERLSKSIENLPRPSRSWWQRIFNR